MLMLVSSSSEKKRLQSKFSQIFKRSLTYQGKLIIGHQGNAEKGDVYSSGNGELWCCFADPRKGTPISRYWNAFGFLDLDRASQAITVELNIPSASNAQQVAAYFAKEQTTGRVYLMHSGKIGGGAKGVGKNAFLAWSAQKPISVYDEDGNERFGLVVGELQTLSIIQSVERFVRQVADFKKLAKSGQLDTKAFRQRVEEFERFSPEFSGRKKGRRSSIIDYVSRHGDIVNALYEKRWSERRANEKIINTPLVDLMVKRGNKTVEVYEVKTGAGRQAIYAAVGQLMVHSKVRRDTRKILVLPTEEEMVGDIVAALPSIGVEVWRFRLHTNGSCDFEVAEGSI